MIIFIWIIYMGEFCSMWRNGAWNIGKYSLPEYKQISAAKCVWYFLFLVFLVILIKAGVKPKTLSVQHHRFLPQLFCSCLTRLKLAVCHTNNVVQFDSSLAQHFLIGTQHSSLTHLLNVGIVLTGNHTQPPRHPKAFASFSLPRVGVL